jgi:hypothetical protein
VRSTCTALVIPEQPNRGNDHRNDRPCRDYPEEREEEEFPGLISGRLRAEKFTAEFVEGRKLRGRLASAGLRC